ncbi:MAG: hypothetical protein AAF328_07050, partial [Planctomycetota bacterium]
GILLARKRCGRGISPEPGFRKEIFLMLERAENSSGWLGLLPTVEPNADRDPAAIGRAIRRWATLAAAVHRAESSKLTPSATVSARALAETVE